MKQTLLLLIIAVVMVGCRNQKEYERGYEEGALSCAYYNYYKKEYPSMGFREYLRTRRIKLPRNEKVIDSIYKTYTSRWEDYAKSLEPIYSLGTVTPISWVGDSVIEGQIIFRNHACIYDSCPHIVREPLVVKSKGKCADVHAEDNILTLKIRSKWVVVESSKIGNQVFKWTDASKAKRGNEMYFDGDTIGKGKRSVTDKYGKAIKMGSYILAVDSLGNIIEDTLH